MTFWSERVLPHAIERVCGGKIPTMHRAEIVPRASGRVLDVGVGSGLNLAHAERARVEKWVGIDPSEALLERARERAAEVELLRGEAEHLPFEDASFDTVVMTYTFCSVADPSAAIGEIARVLVPGGRVLWVEHGIARSELSRAVQRALEPAWTRVAGGCTLQRDFVGMLESTGRFDLESLKREESFPRWMSTITSGSARATRAAANPL